MGKISQLGQRKSFIFLRKSDQIPSRFGKCGANKRLSWRILRKARNLEYVQDELKMWSSLKEASAGYESRRSRSFQGHMDMVAVKKPGRTQG